MAEMCRAERLEDEFFVQTWSGNDKRPICAIHGASDISHCVEVINLKLYFPKSVRCDGLIEVDNPVVYFVPDQPGDTHKYWRRYLNRLDDDNPVETICACFFEAASDAHGEETICTSVTVEWIQTGKTQTIPLQIRVSTD